MLQAYPNAPWKVFVVWVNKLPFDGTLATGWAAKQFAGEARVEQFYDPKDVTGGLIAHGLGASGGTAWDIYLFYPPGARWEAAAAPPAPAAWMHQLRWLDPAHHHSGADLSAHLRRAAAAVLGQVDQIDQNDYNSPMAQGTGVGLAQAKAKLSELVERAQKEGPQTITRHGKAAAVLVSASEWERRTKTKESLYEFFRNSPLRGSGIKIRRFKGDLRDPGL